MAALEFAADCLLARRAAVGDLAAQRELAQRILPRAKGVSHALLRDPANARDASQTAMLEVLRSVHSYRGECSLEHWSDRIISRTALRWIAHERRSGRIPLAEVQGREGELTPTRTFMRECLELLPEPQATALVLRACFEYTVDEIADMTQTSRNTVKDRLVRARQTLRAVIRGGAPAASFNGFAEAATPILSPRRDGRALLDETGTRTLPGRRSRP